MKMKNVKIYPLSDGKYVVSYFDPVRKSRVQKNFSEELTAKTFFASLKMPELKNNKFDYLKTTSTEEAIRIFLEQVPNSYLSQSGKLIREFLNFFSLHGVPRLTANALGSFFIHLKNEFDYSDRSLLVAKSRLQGFFKFLIAQKAIESSPLDEIKFNRGATYKRKPLLFEEKAIQEFIMKAKCHSPALFYPIFLLINETAAKTSDILNIQWKDIHFKTNAVEFFRSTELQSRSFTVSEELIHSLQRIDRVSDHVFTSLEGSPMKKYILSRELKRLQRHVGYNTGWGLRDLRASYGINFLKRGGSITELQKIMGHVKPYQTADIYGRYKQFIPNLLGSSAVQESDEFSLS
jgi:integrase